ncbi:MFS general substrate transporter [Testicularia cyperi]|uniref:MFS general substrate transporter n=1 Tax=Testicularia cyperi TaxID=1882483 RepID=A0A317XVW9_9BASI|nr:MFS general substrate transporter [Testicularia cyperi]
MTKIIPQLSLSDDFGPASTHTHIYPPPLDWSACGLSSSISSFTDSYKNEEAEAEAALLTRFYEPPDSYESKHRWDPKAEWTPEEERKILRKLDWRVSLVACICFAALQLDRGNISNALADNFLKDLHLTTNDYNTGQTIFYVCFLFAELPSQLISKKLGSDVWIPIQMMSWSIVAAAQGGLQNKAGFFVTRALIGLIEGGFIADTILYLSYYFTANELTLRLSAFWVSYTLTNIFGALLAAGLLELRGRAGLEGWRWLFMIEGALTFLVGLWAFFYLPASPTQTVTRWRSKPWFTEREETIIVNKVLRDDPTKSSMHNREGLGLRDLWKSFTDYDLWPLYLLGLINFIAPTTVTAYFTLTLKSLGFTTFQTNLLTIPANVLFIINNIGLVRLSKRLKERLCVSSIGAWWMLVLLITLVTIPNNTDKWAKWAILTLFIGFPYCHPILVSLNSANAGSVRTRTVASSVYNMHVQAAGLIGSNIYRSHDAPYYRRGNRILIGIMVANGFLFLLAKAYYVLRNRSKAKKWNALSIHEKETYLATTKDEGNRRLDFRFLH